jgi:hypothetical protein
MRTQKVPPGRKPTQLDCRVTLAIRKGAQDKSKEGLQTPLDLAGQSHEDKVSGAGVVSKLGKFDINEAGAQRFPLESLNKTGHEFLG